MRVGHKRARGMWGDDRQPTAIHSTAFTVQRKRCNCIVRSRRRYVCSRGQGWRNEPNQTDYISRTKKKTKHWHRKALYQYSSCGRKNQTIMKETCNRESGARILLLVSRRRVTQTLTSPFQNLIFPSSTGKERSRIGAWKQKKKRRKIILVVKKAMMATHNLLLLAFLSMHFTHTRQQRAQYLRWVSWLPGGGWNKLIH